MSLRAQMSKTATIYRPTASRSSTAAVTRTTPGAATATARCALMPKRGEAVLGPAGLILEADAVAYFPAGTDLRPLTDASTATGQGDVVEIDSARYRVIAVRNPGGRGRSLEALLKREA